MNTRELQMPYSLCIGCAHEGLCIHELRANMGRYFYVGECAHYLPEQQNGKWQPMNERNEIYGDVYMCDNCGHGFIICENFNYCPKCGAKMG